MLLLELRRSDEQSQVHLSDARRVCSILSVRGKQSDYVVYEFKSSHGARYGPVSVTLERPETFSNAAMV